MISRITRNISLIALMIFAANSSLSAQGFLKVSGTKIVNANTGNEVILRGMGLGGWLVPEGYMLQTSSFANSPTEFYKKITDLVGTTEANAFIAKYRANYITKKDVDLLASWGFNSIRIPLHYNLLTPLGQPTTFLESGFATIDSALAWCKANNLYLILDLHCAPGGQNSGNISDYIPTQASLWASDANKLQTIALWKKLAERYKNEEWIGGYDLINETAWDLGTGSPALRQLMVDITTAVRQVDTTHIIFVEGNWYATDFNGLEPAWDANMAWSFHKYWNNTTTGTIQYLLDLRSRTNRPLWLGESGENSNQWFADCIALMEANKIGWCWWTHKKVETINGPVSVRMNPEFATLISYWKGQIAKPSLAYSIDALNAFANNLLLVNCIIRPDVIDAILRQSVSDTRKPYVTNNIPGTVFATDYDMGKNTIAYKDNTYQNIAGNGGATWNNGWVYRNDGVDIEACSDFPSNGYDVGWTESGEYLRYTVNAQQPGAYDIDVRAAGGSSGGKLLLQIDGGLVGFTDIPYSGGWQSWQTVRCGSATLAAGSHNVSATIYTAGFNLSYFDFTLRPTSVNDDRLLPHELQLNQNYPNPFNPTTTISYTLPVRGFAKVHVTDLLGRTVSELVSEEQSEGRHQVMFDASTLSSGMYFYSLQFGGKAITRKLTLTR